jgi:hypothetical protein
VAELGALHGALEHRQLLTECEILERDRSVSAADQREGSEDEDERSQHELSCPAITTESTGASDLILANDSRAFVCLLRLAGVQYATVRAVRPTSSITSAPNRLR